MRHEKSWRGKRAGHRCAVISHGHCPLVRRLADAGKVPLAIMLSPLQRTMSKGAVVVIDCTMLDRSVHYLIDLPPAGNAKNSRALIR